MTLPYTLAPEPPQLVVQTQPVAHALAIMSALPRGGDDRHIGVDEWVDRVRLTLTDQQLAAVTLVMWGLGVEGLLNAVDPSDDFSTFYQSLADLSPGQLRDSCLYWLVHSTHRAVFSEAEINHEIPFAELQDNRDQFARYLEANVPKKIIGGNLNAVIDLYFDPQRLHALTLNVLHDLWHGHFKAEWQRQESAIQRVVRAFAQVDLRNLATFDALHAITGRDLRPIFRADVVARFERIVCIPSRHNGPYVMWFGNETTLYIVFTARMPTARWLSASTEPDLNMLIQHLKALADDNRLQVLLAIREQGELSTQDIIEQFDLNKSAASRYLSQLFANGFIAERRDVDGKTKYYSVNHAKIDEFLGTIGQVLKG